jgi:hypothetical protein
MEDVPAGGRCESRRGTEHGWGRRSGPQPLVERPRARLGSGNGGTGAAECSCMTDHTPNEGYSIDRYSRRTSATQSHVFMELWQARCVQGYVAVHLHSKINLGDLAKVTQFSRCKFNRTFKASFGCTPGQYVRRMRIARARLMSRSARRMAAPVRFNASVSYGCRSGAEGHRLGRCRRDQAARSR